MIARRPDPRQWPDLHRSRQGDQLGRRSQRPDLDRGQPVQHQLSDRPVACPQGPRRPLVRDDSARSESGRRSAGQESGVPVGAVTNMTIWGNHSDTQYPDYKNAKINGKPATEVITEASWFTETYVPTVAKRGAAVIKARGGFVGRLGGQRGDRQRASPARTDAAGRLVQRGRGLRRQLRHSRRPDLQLPTRLEGERAWSIVAGVPIDDEARSGSTLRPPSSWRSAMPSKTCWARLLTSDRGRSALSHAGRRPGPHRPGVRVKADDPAAGPAAIDHDRAHLGRFRRAAMADGIDGLDLEMEALRGRWAERSRCIARRSLEPRRSFARSRPADPAATTA